MEPPLTNSYVSPDLQAEIVAMGQRIAELEAALKEIIERWDTPLWRDVEPTAHVIGRARSLLDT